MVDAREVRKLLPIACTLSPADGSARLEDWRRIVDAHGVGRERGAGFVALRFRDAAGVAAAVKDLVDSERVCCAFLGWHLERAGDELVVRITGADDELAALAIGR